MVIWINGCFGVGKTTTAEKLCQRIENAHIYDPELAGAFLWDNFPPPMKRRGDYQDIELWRKINYEYIKYIHLNYSGPIIVPMTLVNRGYHDEIIGKLREDGIDVHHFILTAPKEHIIARLTGRGEANGSWAEQQIDRCLAAFARDFPGDTVNTEQMSADEAAEHIIRACFPVIERRDNT